MYSLSAGDDGQGLLTDGVSLSVSLAEQSDGVGAYDRLKFNGTYDDGGENSCSNSSW